MHKSPAIDVQQFIQEKTAIRVVDVRSPIEFLRGHIPGAINIPLFDDHERANIGLIYKQKGKEEAIVKGMEVVAPKLAHFVRETKEKSQNKKVLIYCFRGGMRSNSFSWLMNTAGLDSKIIEGGYKQYRRFILSQFEKKRRLVLLGGPTGGGKTEILKKIKLNGEQVIDLEGLANHKGSSFGFINMGEQPTQQNFENNLGEELLNHSERKVLWIEDESFAIGNCRIPFPFWTQMKESPIISLQVPFEKRVKRLVVDYSTTEKDHLEKAIHGIRHKLGGDQVNQAMILLQENQLDKIAEMALHYYDDAYNYNHAKKKYVNVFKLETETGNPETNSTLVVEFYKKLVHENKINPV